MSGSASSARPSSTARPAEALVHDGVGDVEVDRQVGRRPAASRPARASRPGRPCGGSRRARSRPRRPRPEGVGHHRDHQVVGHQLAPVDDLADPVAELGPGLDLGAQQVAGGQVGHPEVGGEDGPLGALAGPRRPHEHEAHRSQHARRVADARPPGVRSRSCGRQASGGAAGSPAGSATASASGRRPCRRGCAWPPSPSSSRARRGSAHVAAMSPGRRSTTWYGHVAADGPRRGGDDLEHRRPGAGAQVHRRAARRRSPQRLERGQVARAPGRPRGCSRGRRCRRAWGSRRRTPARTGGGPWPPA